MSVAQRRKREREQRRAAILEAAQKVFTERGLTAATMDQVAGAAEVSKGTLYLYFRSKDELFMALASEIHDEVIEVLSPIAADKSRTGLASFRLMARAYARVALTHPNTIRNTLIWVASGDAVDTDTDGFREYRKCINGIHSLMLSVLKRGQSDGSIRPDLDLVTTLARIWPSIVTSVVATLNLDELKRRIDKPVDGDLLTPGLIDLLARGIAAEPIPASLSAVPEPLQ